MPITSEEINDLKMYYAGIQLPEGPIMLDESTTIQSPANFVESHFQMVENNVTAIAAPYFDRLLRLKITIEQSRERGDKLNRYDNT